MLEDSLFPVQVVQRIVASLILLKYYVSFNWQSVSQIPSNLLLQWENTLSTTAYIKFACVLKLQDTVNFCSYKSENISRTIKIPRPDINVSKDY